MFSKSAKTTTQWSITSKLVILYVITASAGLLLACGFLYWILLTNIDHEHKELLASELAELQKILQKLPVDQNVLKQFVREGITNAHEAHTASFHPSSAHYSYFRLLNSQQQIIVETEKMSSLFPATLFLDDNADFMSIFKTKTQTDDGRIFLLTSRYLNTASDIDRSWYVQAALNVTQDEKVLLQYQKMLGLVLVLGFCFSTLAGFWITRKGLKPLNKITHAVQGISINHLDESISSEKWPKELALLASAFDEMLNRLNESFARLSQFSADLAHELRTPINNLMVETEIALSRQRTLPDYQQVLASNMEEFTLLNRMIEELLFLSRAESPETEIHCHILILEDELKTISTYYESLAADKKIEIQVSGRAKVFADPLLLRRALNNLIANAIYYTDMRGKIKIQAVLSELYTEVHVCDNGIGINEVDLPKIFDRFYRADKARVKNTQGTGLGLSLVKSIMDLHKGTVTIKSKIGQGTTVVLRFPPKQSDK
ncbi:MAG: heavy metal sensor histidine kinase [Methylococcaceae bacterium]|nr:heavy metal sensor histidine kinase [Methylococcaceae bacterium]